MTFTPDSVSSGADPDAEGVHAVSADCGCHHAIWAPVGSFACDEGPRCHEPPRRPVARRVRIQMTQAPNAAADPEAGDRQPVPGLRALDHDVLREATARLARVPSAVVREEDDESQPGP